MGLILLYLVYLEKIDLVVSVLNPVANVGHDLTYSGTVTAAMESVIWGVPAIAFSLNSNESEDGAIYGPASKYAQSIVKVVANQKPPAGVLLNVNIPYLPYNEIKGIKITRQGLQVYHDKVDTRVDPRGIPYYWIGGDTPTGIPEDGTDFGALVEGYISVTPIQLDLTAFPAMHKLKSWDWHLPNGEVIREVKVNISGNGAHPGKTLVVSR